MRENAERFLCAFYANKPFSVRETRVYSNGQSDRSAKPADFAIGSEIRTKRYESRARYVCRRPPKRTGFRRNSPSFGGAVFVRCVIAAFDKTYKDNRNKRVSPRRRR